MPAPNRGERPRVLLVTTPSDPGIAPLRHIASTVASCDAQWPPARDPGGRGLVAQAQGGPASRRARLRLASAADRSKNPPGTAT